ncbi:type VI secretion system-associated FHA domain protein TagH [Pseudomonas lurida]|jgi:type VI secretion system protein ImpI|uniref:type VI secretion system-associated FHA domain protein TagH n=1 Tax=Pseudomonas TaxID=286 RepID=UPI0015E35F8C|nr:MULTISPECIES: type VI secretion system-associated FHA domain protein TagH [Pseudomonas]MBA1292628.1 type VI secretion system-associated FHA domain protein TagH [Pseudomonas lurida]MCP1511413.1 type VI secretion system protein ImpI [Pseudomonas rhodesiae]MDF9770236.1 type VI secretion system protein ImpI [Pseudomonas rhodesiae]
MQLVFEVCDAASGDSSARKVFDDAGGVIGRGVGCDWNLADPSRLLSSHHGLVSYRDGQYFLTDISSNGIGLRGSSERLRKGLARLISDGDVYQLGPVDIRARLAERPSPIAAQSFAGSETIPHDAFVGLDPLQAMPSDDLSHPPSEDSHGLPDNAALSARALSSGDLARDHLIAPRWADVQEKAPDVEPLSAPAPVPAVFWTQFGEALGLRMEGLDSRTREALAIKVAGLFRQTVEGIQQSLRTRDELNSELHLDLTTSPFKRQNPLKDCVDPQAAMSALLGMEDQGQLCTEWAVAQACRELQIHQLALLVACRATVRSAVAAFAPVHLLTCFERERSPSRFTTAGAHWRAYQRHYQRLNDTPGLEERLLREDFSKAYDEQVRLVSTLHTAYPG